MTIDANTRARIMEHICERIASGESVEKIFETPGDDYPGSATFWRWLRQFPELNELYEKATEQRGDLYGEQIVAILDQEPPQIATAFGSRVDTGWVQWNNNRADGRKWVAARMRPKRWGDRTILAGDADNPIQFAADAAIARKLLPELAAGDPAGTTSKPDDD